MGLLRKLGIIEENPNYDDEELIFETDSVDEAFEVDVADVSLDTLIDDIYQQNNLYDKSKSVFKAEEVINSLPKEMVTDTKRNTVIAILASFGLTATDVVEDGDKRLLVLQAASKKIEEEAQAVIAEKQDQIEALKQQIADLEMTISLKTEEIEKSKSAIHSEVKRLSGLVDFMGRGEDK